MEEEQEFTTLILLITDPQQLLLIVQANSTHSMKPTLKIQPQDQESCPNENGAMLKPV